MVRLIPQRIREKILLWWFYIHTVRRAEKVDKEGFKALLIFILSVSDAEGMRDAVIDLNKR